jgi:phage shock protein A
MFEDLQRIFRESVAAFRSELNRHDPEDQVASLLSSMRREWAAGRAELSALGETLERAGLELRKERDLLDQCERRRRLAEGIGDAETVQVASEFAERHRERARVLEQKVSAVAAERELRAREVEEMKRKYQQADANRHVLVSELRRAENQARRRSVADGVEGSFADFDRMREKIDDSESYVEALEDLDEVLETRDSPASPSAADVEQRLRELKRKLGRDG